MKKTLALVLSSVFVFSGIASAQNSSKTENFSIGLEARIFNLMVAPTLVKEVSNIPSVIRQVPSHPDDTWIYGNRRPIITIPDDTVSGLMSGSMGAGISPEVSAWRFRFRSGISLAIFTFGGPTMGDFGSTPAINQYGEAKRGTGTSLVYYSVYGKTSWKPGLVHEVDFAITKSALLIVGYSYDNFRIVGQSGYDRHNSFEKYRDYDLGKGRIYKKYLGLGFQPEIDKGWRPATVNFLVGKTELKTELDGLGEGLNIRNGSPWFFQIGSAYHLNSLRK